jgi:sugar phosphate isomerase/epimerase
MELSVMLFPFHKDLTERTYSALGLIEKLYAVGVSALEPMLSRIDDAPEVFAELRAAAADFDMSYSCLDIGANLIGESEADRAAALDTVSRGVDLCVELDCPVALIPGTRPAPGMSNEEGRAIYSQMLARAAERTADSGVTLTIENFGVTPQFACHSSHVREVVVAAGPEIKVTWDNGNFLLADEMPVDAFPPLAARTVHVHIKDWAPVPTDADRGILTPAGKRWVGAHIGQGHAQVAESLQLIHDNGYDGWISLEVGFGPPLEAAVIGANFVTGVWDSLK